MLELPRSRQRHLCSSSALRSKDWSADEVTDVLRGWSELSSLAFVTSTLLEVGVSGDGVPDERPESEVSSGVAGGDAASVEVSTWRLLCVSIEARGGFGGPVVK